MKELILIRHASAEQAEYPKRDFDRNLDSLGIAEAEKLGRFILSRDAKPEKILCSEAKRTMQTAEKIRTVLGLPEEVLQPSLKMYNSVISVLLDHIREQERTEYRLAIVAHNPEISQLASFLNKESQNHLPTAGAVCLSFDLKNWSEIKPATGGPPGKNGDPSILRKGIHREIP